MSIKFRHIPVNPLLRNHIEKIWVLESSGKIPIEDMKVIVPNGRIKLIIPFRNGFYRLINGCYSSSKEQQINFVGISNVSSIIDFEQDKPSGTIGIEFGLSSAYRFFSFSQQFLIKLISKSVDDTVFDFCINKIKLSNGRITVNQLEKDTGYSRRWLNMKFYEKIGVNPKTLCAITRFTYIFQILANRPDEILLGKNFYNLYYDQAHFIKEFRRFTGSPPGTYEKNINDFGKIFYKK